MAARPLSANPAKQWRFCRLLRIRTNSIIAERTKKYWGGGTVTRQSGFLLGSAVALAAMLAPSLAHAAEPYEINVILPLTGPAAFLGNGEKISLELAEKAMNAKGGIDGRPVKFVIQDDGTSPQTG